MSRAVKNFSLAIAAIILLHVGELQARTPTMADENFCNRYASILQKALEVERSGNPDSIRSFRQTVIKDPQADIILRGMGAILTTPPWVKNIYSQSHEYCLAEVQSDRRGYLPNDPAGRPAPNSPENHIGTIKRIPSK